MKRKVTIIDGYNVIGQSDNLKSIAKESLEEARNKLLSEVATYDARIDDEVIVVFDAYDVPDGQKSYEFHGIKIIFSREKETADEVIERLVYELYVKHVTQIKVVTSDMSEQHTVFGSGALRVSSREFVQALEEETVLIRKDIQNMQNQNPRHRIPLSHDVRKKLEAMRRGKY